MIDITRLESSAIWEQMRPISLEEMMSVRLMSRIDTKFVTHQYLLMPILQQAADEGYNIQFTETALNGYDTVYYDTPEREMYLMHHNRKLRRSKIRCRTYVESDLSFLEIKLKSNKGRTDKIRMPVQETVADKLYGNDEACRFVADHSAYCLPALIPALTTMFHRITLVNPRKTERVTIDINLHFYNPVTGKSASLDNLIILELKQDGRFPSIMRKILDDLRVKPFKISKYCIGTALTDPEIKANRFHQKLHFINKIKEIRYE